MLSIELKGFQELQKAIDKGSKEAENLFLRAMDKSVREVKQIARQESPYDKGNLRRSIDHEVKKGKPIVGIVKAQEKYAPYVEFGTSAHEINSPVLIKGNWYFIKTHPGTKANPFMQRSLKSGTDNVLNNFKEAVAKLAAIITS